MNTCDLNTQRIQKYLLDLINKFSKVTGLGMRSRVFFHIQDINTQENKNDAIYNRNKGMRYLGIN